MLKEKIDTTFTWKDTLKAVWYLLAGQKKPYLFFTAILLLTQFFQLIPSLVIGKIIDFFTNYRPGNSLNFFYICVIGLGIAHATVSMIRLTTKNNLSNILSKTRYSARVLGFEKLLNFSISWHDKDNTGNKVQRIQSGSDALGQLQKTVNQDLSPSITAIIGVLVAFLFLRPEFFFLAITYLVIFFGIQMRFYKRMVRMNEEYLTFLESSSGTYYEGLSNVLTIKTLGVKDDFKDSIDQHEILTRDHAIKIRKIGITKWKVFQIFNALFYTTFLLLVGNEFLISLITLGSIFIFYTYLTNLSDAAGNLTQVFDDVINAKSSIARMMPIYYEQSPIKEGSKSFPRNWQKLELTDATFQYQAQENTTRDPALDAISFSLKKYEKIGVVGRSGSGKSTFAKLLLALYELESGQFTIDQTSFYDLKHDEVTSNIALVLQDSEMFNMTLSDNITLMRPFDVKLFKKAVSIAQLDDLITQLPDGLETVLGEKGYRLSGGERQRIGIARAIYKDPQILILDEATSSLDSKTESLIQESVEKELQQKTMIIVAHRISTLKHVDRIIVFDHGKIMEEGPYEDLLRDKDSYFSKAYHLQQKNFSS